MGLKERKDMVKWLSFGVVCCLLVVGYTFYTDYKINKNSEKITSTYEKRMDKADAKYTETIQEVQDNLDREVSLLNKANAVKEKRIAKLTKELDTKTKKLNKSTKKVKKTSKELKKIAKEKKKLEKLKKKLSKEKKSLEMENSALEEEKDSIQKEYKTVLKSISYSKKGGGKGFNIEGNFREIDTVNVKATAYTKDCKGCSGITKTGVNLRHSYKRVIAVDPSVIPLGSVVELFINDESWGRYSAQDTGGDIKGKRIDVLMPTKKKALAFGVKDNVKVKVLKRVDI